MTRLVASILSKWSGGADLLDTLYHVYWSGEDAKALRKVFRIENLEGGGIKLTVRVHLPRLAEALHYPDPECLPHIFAVNLWRVNRKDQDWTILVKNHPEDKFWLDHNIGPGYIGRFDN
jgi:hypothetical protein